MALSTQEQAVGRPIKHVDVPPEAARAGMLKMGLPEKYVDGLLELYAVMKAGQTAAVSPAVEEVLGRKPVSLEQFYAKNPGVLS